ncbi:MAG: hypothetical protein H7Z14_11020 [Anaerolineae bacterium]|nr:hypothetical protein [Phycisphaerae bacterium]
MARKLRRLSCRIARRSRDRQGASIVYIGIAMFVIAGIVSMGVDIGWIRVARSQLQTAADSSALAGALSLPDADADAARAKAISFAQHSSNEFAGTQVSMQTGDVELGMYWPPNTTFYLVGQTLPDGYKVEESDSNAMRTTGRRTSARSNALPLFFARIFGRTQIDVTATATAYVYDGPTSDGFGIVGINSVGSNGNGATIDSYLPPNYNTRRENAKCASNGDINMGNGDIYGDARPGVNKHLFQGPNSLVTGYTAPLTQPLVFPPAVAPGGATPLGNFSGSTLAPGTYTATKIDLPKDFTVTGTTGNVSIYLNGNLKTSGNTNGNSTGTASRLRIYVIGDHTIDIKGNSDIRMWLYAPDSTYDMNGGTNFWGSIVGKSVKFIGTSNIHYDESSGGSGADDPFKVLLLK